MKILNGVTVLLERDVKPFANGFSQGNLGWSLEFDNTRNNYTKVYEKKAFNRGYELGCCEQHWKVFKGIEGMPCDIYTIKYCIKHGLVEAKDWKIGCNSYGNWYVY